MASKAHLCATSTWGSPSAPKTAVLVHGLGSSSHTWIEVAPELVKQGYYVVAPDLLGHGMAPRSNSYQIKDMVTNMLPLLADRHVDLLIGHSLGGPVSLGLYPHLKTKPERLVLADPALEIDDQSMSAAKNSNINDAKSRPSPEDLRKQQPNWTPNACITKSLAVHLVSADAIEYIGTKIRPFSFTKGLPSADDGVDIIIIGADPEKGTVFTPEEAEALAKTRPEIKCVVAKGAGHGIQREQPALIVRAALESLDSL